MYISLHLCKLKQEMGFLRFRPPPPTLASRAVLLIYTHSTERSCTFSNISEPQLLAILIDQEWLGVVLFEMLLARGPSFPTPLISAGVLLKGDRRRRRSPKSSGMLWPIESPDPCREVEGGDGGPQGTKVLEERIHEEFKVGQCLGVSVRPPVATPGWSLDLDQSLANACFMRIEIRHVWVGRGDIPSWLIHFTLYRYEGNWGWMGRDCV